MTGLGKKWEKIDKKGNESEEQEGGENDRENNLQQCVSAVLKSQYLIVLLIT